MSDVLADALFPHVPADTGPWLPQSNADPYNLVANGMGVGTTGILNAGGTGSTRDSWTIYNNGGTTAYTASKVAGPYRSAGRGMVANHRQHRQRGHAEVAGAEHHDRLRPAGTPSCHH